MKPDPIVVSAVLFRDRQGQVLTVRKRGTDRFMQPGGKWEPGEDARAAAVREVAEEVGVRLEPGSLAELGTWTTAAANEAGHKVTGTVFAAPLIGEPKPVAEIDELRWVSPDELYDAAGAPAHWVSALLTEGVMVELEGPRRAGIERVSVYLGSSMGNEPAFAEAADQVGVTLAAYRVGVVYGGGDVGLMGRVADAALAGGGTAHGVIPSALVDREVAHAGLTELEVVADMHERKSRMAALADAFVVLPGGLGTMEELFEMWTWRQLGLHTKQIVLYDVAGYWRPLLQMVGRMVDAGFVSADFVAELKVVDSPAGLVAALSSDRH